MSEKLSKRIKQLCQEKEMSYYMLSYRSGVPIEIIMNILHGETKNPGIFTISRLCDGFGIEIEEFFNNASNL